MRYLLFAALTVTTYAAVPDYVPPGTKVVVGINIRALVDSPILKNIGDARTMTAQPLPGLAGMPGGLPFAGLDITKDLDDLIIASTGESEKAPTLVVAHGRFPSAMKPGDTYALLDPNTLIGGDAASVKAAMSGRRSGLSPALAARVAALDGRYDIWAVGEVPKGLNSSAAPSPELQAIDRFDFGASLRNGLDLAAQVHVRTSKDAEKIVQMAKLLEMMIAMQPKTGPSGVKFDLKSDANTISLAMYIPEDELMKGIEAQKSRFAQTAVQSGAPRAAAAPSGPEPIPPPKNIAAPGTMIKNDRGDVVTFTLPGRKQ
jgi:hypothetical protein